MCNDGSLKDTDFSWRNNDLQRGFYEIIELHTGTAGWHWIMSGIEDMGP